MKYINTVDELLLEIEAAEHHLHNREVWFGNGATEDSLTPYQITSGNAILGSEVLLLDTGDTPVIAGNTKFDFHRIHITGLSSATVYHLRLIWGTGTVGDAETAKQYTTITIQKIIATGVAQGTPIALLMPQLAVGTKVWAKCKNATNLATLDILVGIHEYTR
jgi:hypothetical protein